VAASPFDDPAVAAGYEDWYETTWGRLADEFQTALILELLGPVRPPATVLDAGRGTGHFAAALAERGYRVVGVDPAAPMLACARQRAPVARADGLRPPFADASFDAALSVSVLEFTDRPEAHLAELRRVARERVVVLTLNSRSYLGLRRRLAGRKGHPVFRSVRPHAPRHLQASAIGGRSVLFLPPIARGTLPGPRAPAGKSRILGTIGGPNPFLASDLGLWSSLLLLLLLLLLSVP
jgi:SAM-dependent methyltransferase